MNKKIKIATRAGLAAGMLCLGGTCMPLHGENAAPVAAQSHINSPAAPGYLSRGAAMTNDGNPRGTIDQLKEALRQFPTANQAEKARLEKALAAMALPGVDAMPMVEAFLSDYPASAWRERALMAVADIYYDRGDYAQALTGRRPMPQPTARLIACSNLPTTTKHRQFTAGSKTAVATQPMPNSIRDISPT